MSSSSLPLYTGRTQYLVYVTKLFSMASWNHAVIFPHCSYWSWNQLLLINLHHGPSLSSLLQLPIFSNPLVSSTNSLNSVQDFSLLMRARLRYTLFHTLMGILNIILGKKNCFKDLGNSAQLCLSCCHSNIYLDYTCNSSYGRNNLITCLNGTG